MLPTLLGRMFVPEDGGSRFDRNGSVAAYESTRCGSSQGLNIRFLQYCVSSRLLPLVQYVVSALRLLLRHRVNGFGGLRLFL